MSIRPAFTGLLTLSARDVPAQALVSKGPGSEPPGLLNRGLRTRADMQSVNFVSEPLLLAA